MPKVQGISHITLICQDLTKTSQLFKEVFEAQEIYDSGNQPFSIAQEKFFLIQKTWFAIMKGPASSKSYNHLAFKVAASTLPLLRRKIKGLGLTILASRHRAPAEGQSLYFYDYDNHLFELHTGTLATRLDYYRRAPAPRPKQPRTGRPKKVSSRRQGSSKLS